VKATGLVPLLAVSVLACGAPRTPAARTTAATTAAPSAVGDRTWAAPLLEADADVQAALVVVESYRQAVKRGDVAALLALASTRYHDDLGTPDDADDVDRSTLARTLARWTELDLVMLELEVRSLVHDGRDLVLVVRSTATIQIEGRRSTRTDEHEMRLAREPDGAFRFLGGM
jgi:hypothetical protein